MFSQRLIPKMSDRIKQLRKKRGYTQKQLAAHIDPISQESIRPYISLIERGKTHKNNKTFLTDYMLDNLSRTFNISKPEIIYGSQVELEEFINYIFLLIAYNFYHNNSDPYESYFLKGPLLNFSPKLGNINQKLIKTMEFYAEFSIMNAGIEEDMPYDFSNVPLKHINKSRKNIYDKTVNLTWKLMRPDIINSFDAYFFNDYTEISMKKLDEKILEWIYSDLQYILSTKLEYKIKRSNLLSIGYTVKKLSKKHINIVNEVEEDSTAEMDYYEMDPYDIPSWNLDERSITKKATSRTQFNQKYDRVIQEAIKNIVSLQNEFMI